MVSTGPYKFETQRRRARASRWSATTSWDPATDPNRKALPDKIEVHAQRERRRHRQPAASPATSTSTWPAPVSSRPTQGRVLRDPNLKKNADSRQRPGCGTSRSTRTWRRWTTSTAARPSMYATDHEGYQTRLRRPAPAATSRPTCCRRSSPGTRSSTRTLRARTRTATSTKAKAGAGGVRPAQRLRHQHLLPGRAAQGEGDRRVAAAGPGQGRHPAHPQGRTRPATTSSCYAGKPDYAKTNSLGLMVNGWGADWPDGFGFLQQITDSRVIRASGGNTNLGVNDPARWTRCSTRRCRRPTRPQREAIWAADRPDGDGRGRGPARRLGPGSALPAAGAAQRLRQQRLRRCTTTRRWACKS